MYDGNEYPLPRENQTKLTSTLDSNKGYREFYDFRETQNHSTINERIIVPEVDFVPIKTKGILKKTDSTTSTGKNRKSIVINTAKNQLREYEPEYRSLYFKEKEKFQPKISENHGKSGTASHNTKENHKYQAENNDLPKTSVKTDGLRSEKISTTENGEASSSVNTTLNKDGFLKLLEILGVQLKIQAKTNQKNLKIQSTFIDEIVALNVIKQGLIEHPYETLGNLDLILNWISTRIQEINPFYVYKILDYIHTLFNLLTRNDLKISDYQANLIIPCLIENFSDSRPYIQAAISTLIKQLSICYDDRKIFKYLMAYIKTSNDTIRVECLEEISFLLNTFFMESYEPEETMNEIASLIGDKNKTIESSAMTIIAVCFIKYGNDAFDYINNYDYIPMIKRHLNANYERINDLARQKFSLDAQIHLVFKYIAYKCKTIDEEMQDFGKKESINNYVININDTYVENSVNALLNVDLFLLDDEQLEYLEDFVDDIIKNCSIALNKALIEYSTNRDSLILNDLIQIIFMTVSHLFLKGLGRLVSVNNLKKFMFSLVIGKKIMSKRDEKFENIDKIFKNLAIYSDNTSFLVALFRVLNESLKKENSLLEFSNYVVKILLFWLKGIEFDKIDARTDQKLETLNQDLIGKFDPALILIEIHAFLEQNPTLDTDLTSGMAATAVNALVQDLVSFYGSEIFEFLDEKVISSRSQIMNKINHNINITS